MNAVSTRGAVLVRHHGHIPYLDRDLDPDTRTVVGRHQHQHRVAACPADTQPAHPDSSQHRDERRAVSAMAGRDGQVQRLRGPAHRPDASSLSAHRGSNPIHDRPARHARRREVPSAGVHRCGHRTRAIGVVPRGAAAHMPTTNVSCHERLNRHYLFIGLTCIDRDGYAGGNDAGRAGQDVYFAA